MRQVWIPRTGPPGVLEVREAADPAAGEGEVRVRVAAAGVNFADVLARMGLYPDAPPLPAVVGYEVSGTVDAVGEGVERVAVGDRVAALTRFGGYADTVVVPAGQLVPLPEGFSLEAAAAIPVNYLTAWLMLVHHAGVRSGETVLVHAAAGGVGQAALQICQHRGAEVIGTASQPKHDRLRQMGVKRCIDYRSEDFEERVLTLTGGRGVDVALDAVGGKSFKKSYRCLAPLGKLFMFGISSFAPGRTRSLLSALRGFVALPRFGPVGLMNDNKGVFGVNLGHLWDEGERLRDMMAELFALAGQGTLRPVVDATFPFARAHEAHAYLQDRRNFGKVLLTPE